ncbi:MAG: hypothetical protein AB7S26_27930 [Sandaracinaceae bacterium]
MRNNAGLLALVCLVGCSSGYKSGVDGQKPVSTLSMDEAQTACTNLSVYFRDSYTEQDSISFQCYLRALSTTTDPTACQADYNACIIDPPDVSRPTIDCTNAQVDSECNATVSQVESCVTDYVNASLDRIHEVDCSVAGNIPELQRLQTPPPRSSSCSSIDSICPNLPGADG